MPSFDENLGAVNAVFTGEVFGVKNILLRLTKSSGTNIHTIRTYESPNYPGPSLWVFSIEQNDVVTIPVEPRAWADAIRVMLEDPSLFGVGTSVRVVLLTKEDVGYRLLPAAS